MSVGKDSPNQTTPGRWRPVLQDGHLGSEDAGIGVVSISGAWAWAAVFAAGARRVSSEDVMASEGWNGSS